MPTYSQADVRAVDNAIAAGAPPVQSAAWWNVAARFKAAAADFERAYARLLATASYAASRPALAARYNALAKRARTIRATVLQIRSKLDAAIAWLRSAGSAVGLAGAAEGLGVIPLLGIAAIAAAVALVTKWTSDTVVYFRMVDEQRRLEAAGVAPEQAATIAQGSAQVSREFGWGSVGGKVLPLLIVAAGGWWALREWGKRQQ